MNLSKDIYSDAAKEVKSIEANHVEECRYKFNCIHSCWGHQNK